MKREQLYIYYINDLKQNPTTIFYLFTSTILLKFIAFAITID